jgi:outer membrane protein assembly factor BamB
LGLPLAAWHLSPRTPPSLPGCLGAFLVAWALLGVGSTARAQTSPTVELPGESRPTGRRIEEVQKRLAARDYDAALTEIRALLDRAGDDLVPVGEGHSVRCRRLCHALLAGLPPASLDRYRRPLEAQASRWLRDGLAEQDPGLLRKVVEEAFVSGPAAEALERLGDGAFLDGRFAEAQQWWALVAPLQQEKEKGETFPPLRRPSPGEAVARVQAKQLLARLFRGPGPDFPDALAAFRKKHPKASGTLAGREGVYADLLEQFSRDPTLTRPPTPPRWATLGGAPSRARVLRDWGQDPSEGADPLSLLDHLGRLCRAGPTWTFDLQTRGRLAAPPLPHGEIVTASRRARSLAFHPLLVRVPDHGSGGRDFAVVADARYVTAYDLRDGTASVWYDAARFTGGINPELKLPAPADLSYSLTAADGALFARLGLQEVQDVRPDRGPESNESLLVRLDLPRRAGDKPSARWMVRALAGGPAVFEGAPVVRAGRVYIAATRQEGDRTVTAIHCYPARPEDAVPPLLWKVDVCSTGEFQATPKRTHHHLLTAAGRYLVYCSHSGAVVAVDAYSGKRAWGVRYRRVEESPDLRGRRFIGVGAPVFADGKVFVAPADSDLLMALDPATGKTLWERERLGVVEVLGVGQGRLIFSTRTGLRAVGADDGGDEAGWVLPDGGGKITPMGRGLLAGDLVLWPTDKQPWGVFALRQKDGRQPPFGDPTLLRRIPAGNLVLDRGYLLVTDRRSLHVFVPPDAASDLPRGEVGSGPKRKLDKHLREARRKERAGRPAEAVEVWQRVLAEPAWRSLPVYDERGLPESAAALAESAIARLRAAHGEAVYARFEKQADHLWRKAREEDRPRLAAHLARLYPNASVTREALAFLARHYQKADRPAQAAEAWRQLLRRGPTPRQERSALVGLARAYERGRAAGGAAERVWERLASRHGDAIVPELNPTLTVRDWVRARLMTMGLTMTVPDTRPILLCESSHLAPGERFLSPPGGAGEDVPSLLWMVRPEGALVARSADNGQERWVRPLPFVPEWVGLHADLVIAGGKGGLAGLRRVDGGVIWEFHSPQTRLYPRGPSGPSVIIEPGPTVPLGSFSLAGGRVFCLQGGRLLAVDAETGRALWQRWAPGGLLEQTRGFAPHLVASEKTVLVRPASGRRWLLDAASGKLLLDKKEGSTPWLRPPLTLGTDAVAVMPSANRVELVDPQTGRTRWSHVETADSTLSGEPLDVAGAGEVLLVIVPTNLGYEVQRLDIRNGRAMWPRAYFLTTEQLPPSRTGWAFSTDAIFLAREGMLTALSPADGSVKWEQPLDLMRSERPPDASWDLFLHNGRVFACPAEQSRIVWRFSWLLAGSQWTMNDSRFVLLAHNAGTGRATNFWGFPRDKGPVWRERTRASWAPVLPRLWVSRVAVRPSGPTVLPTRKGVAVVAGGKVWVLKPKEE